MTEDELKDEVVAEENAELQGAINNYLQGRVVSLGVEIKKLKKQIEELTTEDAESSSDLKTADEDD